MDTVRLLLDVRGAGQGCGSMRWQHRKRSRTFSDSSGRHFAAESTRLLGECSTWRATDPRSFLRSFPSLFIAVQRARKTSMPSESIQLDRRRFLAAGAVAAGLLVTRGWRSSGFDPTPLSFDETLRHFLASLTSRQRDLIVFPVDHPTRQILNTQTVVDRPHLATVLSPTQRSLVQHLYASMLSPRGVDLLTPTVAVEGRFDGCVLAIYGEPDAPESEVVFQGGHVMVRGGAGRGRDVLGGAAYGHQTGNHKWKVPGNSFAHHGDAANRIFAALPATQRDRAIVARPPHELALQAQGPTGHFDGVRVGDLEPGARSAVRSLLDTVLATYPDKAATDALASIEANGGIDALHFAVYATHGFYEDMQTYAALSAEERARRGDPYWQVWRLEGPGTIVHFQGHPHVHAYVRIVRDPVRANVGSVIAVAERTVEGADLRRLMAATLRRASDTSLTYVADNLPGRICAGDVTTGVAYALDPYRNHVVVARLRGKDMSTALRAQAEAAGEDIDPMRSYRVATLDYYATERGDLGRLESVEAIGTPLREAMVEQLRRDGVHAAA